MARANNLKVLATVVAAVVATCLLMLVMVSGPTRQAQAIGPNAVRAGFNDNTLNRNDDSSTGQVTMGFSQPLNFFSNNYSQLYVNNNGNVTFDQPLGTYTPFDLTSTGTVIIAPFFGDVDTRNTGTAPVTYGYGTSTVDGHDAFGVNWVNVGYYNSHADKLNNFQLVLIDRSDIEPGDFDIEFNYDRIQWETGDASGGSGGLGGNSARAGFSNGTGVPGTSYELPGSAVNGAFLDSNLSSGLIHNSLNSTQPGRYLFQVRNGVVVDPDNQPPAVQSAATDALGTEGDTLQASGAFSDPDDDPLTLSVPNGTPGTFTDNGDGTWSWELATNDDVAGGTITVTADDGNGGTVTDEFTYSAANADPDVAIDAITKPDGTSLGSVACLDGNKVSLDFSFTDAGSADTHDASIDWGDNSTDTAIDPAVSPEENVEHTYTDPGSYTITVTVTDDDSGEGTADNSASSLSFLYNMTGILSPFNATQPYSTFKYGSTVPVKVQITDCAGTPVSGLAPKLSVVIVSGDPPTTTINEEISSTSAADSGSVLRYSDGQYIFNMNTKSSLTPDSSATYTVVVEGTTTTGQVVTNPDKAELQFALKSK